MKWEGLYKDYKFPSHETIIMPCDYKNKQNKRANSINSQGIMMSLAPYTRCYHKTLPCKLLNGSKKCGECRRANVTCDIDPPTNA